VCAHTVASWCLWLLGYPDQGFMRSREAVELGESLSHLRTMGAGLRARAVFEQLRRDGPAARESAEALMSVSQGIGFPLLPPQATSIRGWALAQEGRLEEGISLMREGLSALSEAMFAPYFLVHLAEACGMAGAPDDALVVLDGARARIGSLGEYFYEAELHRVRGQLLLQCGEQADESEAAFRLAVETARRQEGKSLELRATTSLAELWQGQGRNEQARDLLQPVYDWFTEGFDTKDLMDAKALLKELA
jgi:predicted ATPase